jgi:uncharacterized membrane protein
MQQALIRSFEGLFFLLLLTGELGFVNAGDSRKVSLVAFVLLWSWRKARQQSVVLPALVGGLARLHVSASAFWGVIGGVASIALLFVLTKSFALGFTTFDTGIFHQLIWAISEGMGFHSSISRAVDFLRDHLVLSLALLSPVYRVFDGSPLLTPIWSALLLVGGIALLISAFRVRWQSSALGFGIAIVPLLISQSIWENLGWGFHDNHVGFFGLCLGFAIWARLRDRFHWKAYFGSVLAFLVAAFSKESLLLQVGTLFLVWSVLDPLKHFSIQGRAKRALSLGLGVGLLACFVYYATLPKHAEKNYFLNYFGYLGSSLHEVAWSLLSAPDRVLEVIGLSPILWYLGTLLTLGGFFFLLKPFDRVNALLIPLLVPVGLAVIAQYDGLRSPGMHYVLEILPLLWFVSLWHLAQGVGRPFAQIVWVIGTLFLFSHSPTREIRRNFASALHFSELRTVLRSIPRDRVVMADAAPAVWLSDRPWILTWWKNLEGLDGRCPELYVVYAPDEATRLSRLDEMRALGLQCRARAQERFERLDPLSRAGFEFYEPRP